MSATACQFCGKSLSRLSLRRDGDFCSREHREQYRLRRGMNRVIEASEVTELERRKERPQLIPLQPAATNAGSGKRRSTPDVPRLGHSPCDFLTTGPVLITKLRPARAGAVASPGSLRAPDETPRRTDPAPVHIRSRMEFKAVALLARHSGRVRLHMPDFDCLTNLRAGPEPRPRPGSERPLSIEPRELPLRAVHFSVRGGSGRLAAAALAPGMPQAGKGPAPAVHRGAAEAGFPSAIYEGGVPIPPARRRTGKPVKAPSAGFAGSRVLRAFLTPPNRRGSEQCFRAGFAGPVLAERAGKRSAGISGFSACAEVMCALRSAPAPQGRAEKRSPAAADFWDAIPAFFRIAIPVHEMLPSPPRCRMGRRDRPFVLPRGFRRSGRQRVFNVPQPSHAPAFPSWAAALVEASRSFGSAAPAPLPMTAASMARAEARGYGTLPAPLAAHSSALPVLRPWRIAQGFGATPASASPLPPRMPAPSGGRPSVPRLELTRFAGAPPMMPAAELDIVSLIGGNLEAANGKATVIEDHFASGLSRWVGGLEDWRIDAAGVRPGALALFSPSLGMRDYEFEFLAKVEQRGIGWVCRAADLSNYYLLTISVAGEGKSPVLQLTRRAVKAGVAGAPVTMPVPVAVRSKAAFRVQTCVSGAGFAVSVEGHSVDRWTDNHSTSGGIGFIAGQDDRARLYWVKLTPRGTGFPGRRVRPASPAAGAVRVYGVNTNEQHAN